MNEFFKKWLDKQQPLSVNPLHNGQYYLTDEQAIDFAKMYGSEQLRLHRVSHRRELLLDFMEWYNEDAEKTPVTNDEIDLFIKEKLSNCG